MIRLFALPHHEARAILSETDAPVFLTANPVEFHGPHLPLWTDHLISTGLNGAGNVASFRVRHSGSQWSLGAVPALRRTLSA